MRSNDLAPAPGVIPVERLQFFRRLHLVAGFRFVIVGSDKQEGHCQSSSITGTAKHLQFQIDPGRDR
eukprot:gene19161-19535_t